MNFFKKIIKSTEFLAFAALVLFVGFLYWAIGPCGGETHDSRSVTKTETSFVDMEVYTESFASPASFTSVEPVSCPRETEHDFPAMKIKIRIIPSSKTVPKRLALLQQNTLVASTEISEDVKDFRVMNYSVGVTGAHYINVEAGNKLYRLTSYDMYWEKDGSCNDFCRVYPEIELIKNAVATTATAKSFDNGTCFTAINTTWQLVDGVLFADDQLVLTKVMSIEHFPLVQTKSGWSIIRYDRKDDWVPQPFTLYEANKQELFRLLSTVAGTKTAEVQHGVANRLNDLGITKDDIDTAQKTIFVRT